MKYCKEQKKIFVDILFVVSMIVLLFKMVQGIMMSDEAYYIALMQRFTQGDVPIIDEWHPTQLFVIPILPLYWLYRSITGGNDGILFLFRFIMTIWIFIVAYISNNVLRRKGCGILVRTLTIGILLFYLARRWNGLNYYVIAFSSILIGNMILEKGEINIKKRIVFGILIGLAITSNPYVVLCVLAYSIGKMIQSKGKDWKALLQIYLGIMIIGVPCLGYILYSSQSFTEIIRALPHMMQDDPTHPGMDVIGMLNDIKSMTGEYFVFCKYTLFVLSLVLLGYRIIRKKEISYKIKMSYFLIHTLYMFLVVGRSIVLSDNIGDVIFVFSFYV